MCTLFGRFLALAKAHEITPWIYPDRAAHCGRDHRHSCGDRDSKVYVYEGKSVRGQAQDRSAQLFECAGDVLLAAFGVCVNSRSHVVRPFRWNDDYRLGSCWWWMVR